MSLQEKDSLRSADNLPVLPGVRELLATTDGNHQASGVTPLDSKLLGDRAHVYHGLFSKEECKGIIDFFESQRLKGEKSDEATEEKEHVDTEGQTVEEASSGHQEGSNETETAATSSVSPEVHMAGSNKQYRNNLRIIASSPELSDLLTSRILPLLVDEKGNVPAEDVTDENHSNYSSEGLGMRGTWRFDKLNFVFRICKYDPNGHFGPHYDSDYIDHYHRRSLKTFMIYLNDDYAGGTTNFVHEHSIHFDEATQRYCSPKGAVALKYKAAAGDALVFDHHILHEGGTVEAGVKYIIRSELMYVREPTGTAQEKVEEEAYTALATARLLDAEGRAMESIPFYKRAFKLMPELERVA